MEGFGERGGGGGTGEEEEAEGPRTLVTGPRPGPPVVDNVS